MSKQQTFGRSRPSIAYELQYRKELQKLVAEMQKDVKKELTEYLKQETAQDKAMDAVLKMGAKRRLIRIMKFLRKRWYREFDRKGRLLAEWMAEKNFKRTEAQVQRKLKQLGMTLEPHYTDEDKKLIREIIKENVSMMTALPQQYLAGVQQSMTESFERGFDSAHLMEHFGKFMDIEDERVWNFASLLTRDQMNRATQRFAIASAKSVGCTKGRWIHVPGKRSSRVTHIKMDGKEFPLDEGLYDSDVGRFVKPGELSFCNCQFEVIIPGFE